MVVCHRRDAKFASVKKLDASEAVAKPTSLFVFEKNRLHILTSVQAILVIIKQVLFDNYFLSVLDYNCAASRILAYSSVEIVHSVIAEGAVVCIVCIGSDRRHDAVGSKQAEHLFGIAFAKLAIAGRSEMERVVSRQIFGRNDVCVWQNLWQLWQGRYVVP